MLFKSNSIKNFTDYNRDLASDTSFLVILNLLTILILSQFEIMNHI